MCVCTPARQHYHARQHKLKRSAVESRESRDTDRGCCQITQSHSRDIGDVNRCIPSVSSSRACSVVAKGVRFRRTVRRSVAKRVKNQGAIRSLYHFWVVAPSGHCNILTNKWAFESSHQSDIHVWCIRQHIRAVIHAVCLLSLSLCVSLSVCASVSHVSEMAMFLSVGEVSACARKERQKETTKRKKSRNRNRDI